VTIVSQQQRQRQFAQHLSTPGKRCKFEALMMDLQMLLSLGALLKDAIAVPSTRLFIPSR